MELECLDENVIQPQMFMLIFMGNSLSKMRLSATNSSNDKCHRDKIYMNGLDGDVDILGWG